jgi:hypothetical protein
MWLLSTSLDLDQATCPWTTGQSYGIVLLLSNILKWTSSV